LDSNDGFIKFENKDFDIVGFIQKSHKDYWKSS